MNLVETLDFYALKNGSDDLFLMLKDYVIDNRIDRDKMNRIIIKELGNATPFTNQTTILKFAIEEFFEKYSGNITRLIDTMYLEYNPLNTKSIERELTEHQNKTSEVDVTGTENQSKNSEVDVRGTEGEDRTSEADIANTDDYTTTKTLNSEDMVSAYDSSTYQPKDKNTTTDQTVHDGDTTSHIESTVGSDKTTTEKTEAEESSDKTSTEKTEAEETTGRGLTESISGKDGDLSYQTLIEQERKLAEFNIFNWIIKLMRKELFLLVY